MAVLVDSNVILDVMTEDPIWMDWSSKALSKAADEGRLVINPVIYAEVSVRYTRIEALELAFASGLFDREPLPFEAAFLAGKVFLNYRHRGGTQPSTLPDFFIGAHAAVAGYGLLTRDSRRFRTYFPKLSIIGPAVEG
jgi:predicted nucleic acid-binding protein